MIKSREVQILSLQIIDNDRVWDVRLGFNHVTAIEQLRATDYDRAGFAWSFGERHQTTIHPSPNATIIISWGPVSDGL